MEENVPKAERAAYLANLLSIAGADADFSPRELSLFRAVAERIGANQKDVDGAREMHRRGETGLHVMQSPKLCMANMQDMIAMAMVEGGVAAVEGAPIEKLAGTLKYSQADMDIMVRRAELTITRLAKRIASETAGESRDANDEPAPPASPPMYAAKVIESRPAPSQSRPDRVVPHVPPATRTQTPVKTTLTPAACAECRHASAHPAEYCFGLGSARRNIWGCRLLELDWAPGAEWLADGQFREDDTFVWDRAAIAQRVENRLPAGRDCPHLDEAYIAQAAEALPRFSTTCGHWRYVPAGNADMNTHHIQEFSRADGRQMAVSGIEPEGTREAVKVIRRATRRAGRTDVDVRLLRQ